MGPGKCVAGCGLALARVADSGNSGRPLALAGLLCPTPNVNSRPQPSTDVAGPARPAHIPSRHTAPIGRAPTRRTGRTRRELRSGHHRSLSGKKKLTLRDHISGDPWLERLILGVLGLSQHGR